MDQYRNSGRRPSASSASHRGSLLASNGRTSSGQRPQGYRTSEQRQRASSGVRRTSASQRPSSSQYDWEDEIRKMPRSAGGSGGGSKGSKKKRKKKSGAFVSFLKWSFLVFLILLFAAVGIGAGAYLGIIKSAPNLDMITIEPNVYTSIIYDNNGTEIDRFHGEENREYVTLDKIPIDLQHAIIAIEDARFYEHNGIDARGIARAAYVMVKSKLSGGTRTEGASTITQQLIKNNVTKVSRNSLRTKIQEQYLAVKYEQELTERLGSKKAAKDYILELYLNTIGLNSGYNGVQTAAKGYFNKDVTDLSLAESACIAGITNNPSYYTPREHPENNRERQQRILSNMLEQGYITAQEYSDAVNEDIYSRVYAAGAVKDDVGRAVHTYFVDGLFEQISKDLQDQYSISEAQANNIIYNSGLQIYSTLDLNMQQTVDEAYLDDSLFPKVDYKIEVTYTVSVEDSATGIQNHSEYRQLVKSREAGESFVADKKAQIEAELGENESIISDKAVYNVEPQSAMVIMDYRTGEVKALSGGRGDKLVNRGFNRAVDSARQPGSVFKVLASFAPGIDMGKITPATVFDDVPYTIGNYSPKNWYSNPPYRGLSTVRDGIRDSMNIVAVKSMVHNGVDACYDYLLNFGFTTLENDNNAAAALGGLTKGVTQLEVTAAFGAIANGGAYNRPMFYSRVLDHDGNVILENAQESKQVLKKTSAYLLTDMMQDVVKSGTGTQAAFKSSKMPVAGKTGTSQESRDLTFVGYTPYYVAGVWLGYDNYDKATVSNMSDLNQSTHLVLWRTIMEKIHQNYEVKSFEKPNGIVSARICTESGKLAGSLCGSDPRGTVRTEIFAEGTQPTDYCNVHKAVSVCKDSGMSPSKYCPSSSIVSSVGIVRPTPYNGSETIGDRKYEVGNLGICNVHSSGTVPAEGGGEPTEDESSEGEENAGEKPETGEASEPATEVTTKSEVSIGEIIPSTPQTQQTQTPAQTPAQPQTPASAEPPAPVMPEVSAAVDSFDGNIYD